MFIGDLAFVAGAIGLFTYMCLIIVRHASQSGRLVEKLRRYENAGSRLQARLEELRAQRAAVSPEADELLEQMIELRDRRDKLQMQYEDMVDSARRRQITIKTKRGKG